MNARNKHTNRTRSSKIVCAVTVVLALGLSACGPAGPNAARQAAGDQSVGPIEAAGPLPVRQASGPFNAELPPSTAANGEVAHSPRPYLIRPREANGSAEYRVYDISAGGGSADGLAGPIWQATSSDDKVQIDPKLSNGHLYGLQWRDAGGGGGSKWNDAGEFNVSFTGGGKGTTESAGGVDVSMITGESSWAWQSHSLPGPRDSANVSLEWRPSNPAQPGMPPGWQLSANTGSTWAALRESAVKRDMPANDSSVLTTAGLVPAAVTVTGWAGGGLTFTLDKTGVYRMQSGLSETAKSPSATLVREDGGSWLLTETDGTVTSFKDGRASTVRKNAMPVSTLTWNNDGALASVANSIGSKLELTYAGSNGAGCGSASWSDSGWAKPPVGKLCAVSYPSGTRADIGYDGALSDGGQIGLIKDPGNTGATLGWDTIGRLAGVRSELANRSYSALPAAKSLQSVIEYDASGRVNSVTNAPANPGESALLRTIDIPEPSLADVRAGKPVEATTRTAVIAPTGARTAVRTANNGFSQTATIDSQSWTALATTDRASLASSQKIDNRGRVSATTDAAGRVTKYSYNASDKVTEQSGGVASGAGAVAKSTYDSNADQRAWTGMQVSLYPNESLSGDSTPGSWDDESLALAMSFQNAPVGQGKWSALAQGIYTPPIEGNAQKYSFKVESSGLQATLYIDGRRCETEGKLGNCTLNLGSGPHQVQVQVQNSSSDGAGFFSIKAGPDTAKSIPARQVQPGFGLNTRTAINDVYPGSKASEGTTSQYDKPWLAEVAQTIAPSGLTSQASYEPVEPAKSQWGRMTSQTSASGKQVQATYWGDNEKAGPPAPCDGDSASQAGQLKSMTSQDGSVLTETYDSRGRLIASANTGPGGETETACNGYNDRNELISTAHYNNSGDLIERSETDPSANGKAWVVTQTVTHGAKHPVSPNSSVTSTTVMDLGGAIVSYRDYSGVTTTTVYDSQGQASTKTITPAVGPPLRLSFEYGARTGWPTKISEGATPLASITYTDSGQIDTISYLGGARQRLAYAANGAVAGATVTGDGKRYVQQRTRNDAGRVLADELTVTGDSPFLEKRAYEFDANAALTGVKISGTSKTSIGYGFGKQNAACSQGYDAGLDGLRTSGSRGDDRYYTCYNDRGQPVETTDPLITAGKGTAKIDHDAMGRVTAIGGANPVTLNWSSATGLSQLIEKTGTGEVSTTLDTFDGRIVNKTVAESGASTSRVTYAFPDPSGESPVFVLGSDGKTVQQTSLALPGGARLTQPSQGTATLDVSGVDGSLLATIPVPELNTGKVTTSTVAAQESQLGLAPRLGAFGEPLAVPKPADPSSSGTPTPTPSAKPADTATATESATESAKNKTSAAPEAGVQANAMPRYGWQLAARHETLAGSSGIVLQGTRPLAPALGQFLAVDPEVGGANNVYAYTSGDPINNSDPTGNSEASDLALPITAGVSLLLTVVSISKIRRLAFWAKAGMAVVGTVAGGTVATITVIQAVNDPSASSIATAAVSGLSTVLGLFALGRLAIGLRRAVRATEGGTTLRTILKKAMREPLWKSNKPPVSQMVDARNSVASSVRAPSFQEYRDPTLVTGGNNSVRGSLLSQNGDPARLSHNSYTFGQV